MATYKDIQMYVKGRHGYTVKNCWIAHVKEQVGLAPRPAPNRQSVDQSVYPCPPDKAPAIREAFRHFGMI